MTKLPTLLLILFFFPTIILAGQCTPSTGLCLNTEFHTADGYCLPSCDSPLIKGSGKLCSSPCASLDDFIYPDKTCLPQCPSPFEVITIGSFKLCKTECNKNQYATYNGRCQDTCPDPFLAHIGNGLKLCACPSGQYVDEDGNCGSCASPKKLQELCCGVLTCVKPCPSNDLPYYSIDDDICIATCPSGQWSNVNGVGVCSSQPTGNVVSGTVRLDANYQDFLANNGEEVFKQNLASALGIDESLIRITGTREGSVIIEYEVVAPSELGQPTSFDTLQDLATQISTAIDSGALIAVGETLNNDVNAVGTACADGLYLNATGDCVADCGDIWQESVYGGILFCAKPCPSGQFWREDLATCQATCIAPYENITIEDVAVCRFAPAIHALLRYPIGLDGYFSDEDATIETRNDSNVVVNSISSILQIDPSEIIVIGVLTDTLPTTTTNISVYIHADPTAENINLLQTAAQNNQLDLYGGLLSSSFTEYNDSIAAATLSPQTAMYFVYDFQVIGVETPIRFNYHNATDPVITALGLDNTAIAGASYNSQKTLIEGDGDTAVFDVKFDLAVSYKLSSSPQNVLFLVNFAETGHIDYLSPVQDLQVTAFTPLESE